VLSGRNGWKPVNLKPAVMGSDCAPKILHLISSGGFYGAERMVVQLSLALESLGCRTLLGVFRNEPRPNLEVAPVGRQIRLGLIGPECIESLAGNIVTHYAPVPFRRVWVS